MKTFNSGGLLTVSKVQSITSWWVAWKYAGVLEKELRILHLASNRKSTKTLGSFLSIGNP